MIDINFSLSLLNSYIKSFYLISGKTPIRYKFWELHFYGSDELLAFHFKVSVNTDHAGLFLSFGILTFGVEFNLYDSRHWDYEGKDWISYE